MKKFKVEFDYQDRNACGLKFKHAKRTVKAKSEEDAVRKLEQALTTTIINPKFIEVVEEPKTEEQTEEEPNATKPVEISLKSTTCENGRVKIGDIVAYRGNDEFNVNGFVGKVTLICKSLGVVYANVVSERYPDGINVPAKDLYIYKFCRKNVKRFYFTDEINGEDCPLSDHIGQLRGAIKVAQQYADENNVVVYINDCGSEDIVEVVHPESEFEPDTTEEPETAETEETTAEETTTAEAEIATELPEEQTAEEPKVEETKTKKQNIKWINESNVRLNRGNYEPCIFKFDNSKVWFNSISICTTQSIKSIAKKMARHYNAKEVTIKYLWIDDKHTSEPRENVVDFIDDYYGENYKFRIELPVKEGEKRQFRYFEESEIFCE
jgi:hypothetical protein